MSSTQHQLIEQCATRLRGIVEALDNIHDSTQHRSPHRWSTDLDEVHSSAESLLAMIKDQAPPSEDQLIAAGLSYPLAKEDAVQLWYAGFRSEVVTVLEAWEAIGHDIGMNPSKGELLDSLRNMAAICNAHGNDMPAQSAIDQRQVIADAITGALAFGAQASQPPAEDHWLRPFYDIGRAEGQRTQELAMLVRMLAASLKRHAPESNLVARATNYLAAKGLAGTPLRDPPAPVEQAGGDERAAFEAWATHLPMDRQPLRPDLYMPQTQWAWEAWQFRAALAQPSQSQYEASFEEWLANELEGEDGQPVPAAVCDITLARRAFNHWPKLEQPAKVGGVRFSAGVSSRLVVEAAQRLNEFESTPEKEAERIERLQAFREQLDPLNLAPHAEAFNEAPDEALRPEQAEAERPEGPTEDELEAAGLGYPLHKEEAVKLWYSGFRSEVITVLEAWEAIGHDIGMNPDKGELLDSLRYMLEKCEAHDAALARVAELERQQPVAWMHDQPNRVDVIHRDVKDLLQRVPGSSRGIYRPLDVSEHYTIPLYAAPVAQAQHSVPEISGIGRDAEHPRAVVLYLRNEPSEEDMRAIQNFLRAISADVLTQAQHSAGYAEARQCVNCRHIGINDAADYAACHDCRWTGPEPDEDKCPGCAGENCMAAACPECGGRYELVAEAKISTPAAQAGQVPQAWLDVQAERRRQVEAEGWTPEHDDEHADGQMARAAACYALAGSSAPNDGTAALLVSLAWPWDEQWWKPSTARRDLVKACALALAEIERLDRACISQSPQPGATTASS
ncbi:hypothetical protein IPC618_21445 [Pseudomonas aeruginosa]|uniref:hypothetical protein n=2 Tax=Pseudomonas aeruginosa TaxID=287 RepID=UPI0004DA3CE5|nr:hypothetical protein [Pseudomonas aeruginosa]KEA27965.1 hypothetical protein BH79_23750 [Pseudomonas aeruginosa C0324C]MCS8049502.1 hypothetical protein [Pseudomonas aeruginosa]PBL29685.1 hypothetical protein B8A57_14980 [Pseudomonas aeruginosa]RQA65790.1 hypothetical protein IPC483_11880 [Pseudomonas aeruginosa]TEJ14939.1 hypothetical protein IPC620_16515 [Pseudomonas aeruginosa]